GPGAVGVGVVLDRVAALAGREIGVVKLVTGVVQGQQLHGGSDAAVGLNKNLPLGNIAAAVGAETESVVQVGGGVGDGVGWVAVSELKADGGDVSAVQIGGERGGQRHGHVEVAGLADDARVGGVGGRRIVAVEVVGRAGVVVGDGAGLGERGHDGHDEGNNDDAEKGASG